jgi:DNA-binding SARP family transcriptional activator/tetratricopeptide (TPR) repeat protein
VEFRILGPVELWVGGSRRDFGSRKERCLLAALAYEQPGRPVSANTLMKRVWDTNQPDKARESLYPCVSRIRKALRETTGDDRDWVPQRDGAYTLAVSADAVDLWRFRRLRDQARQARAAGDEPRAVDLFGTAERLWRGEPLAGLDSAWALSVRVALEEDRLTVITERIEAGLRLGQHADLIGELSGLLAQHPLAERIARNLMLALYQSERRADALDVARRTSIRLREAGSSPGPELRELHQRMLNDDPGLSAKNEPIISAGRPSAAIGMPGVRGNALPRDNPDFTGRAEELRVLADWIGAAAAQRTSPVIVISGMPGVGKSTLALHAAHLFGAGFPDRLHVGLRAHAPSGDPLDPVAVLGTMLRELGVHGTVIPADAEERAAMLRARLAARGALIVLDDALDADQVMPLLPGVPGSLVIITTRLRPFSLSGMLHLPLETMPATDAGALFVLTAGARPADSRAAIATVASLCGHLPLAIRLAAGRLRRHPAWTASDLADHLRAIQGRDREIARSLDFSYRYLPPDQQRLFRLLALSPGESFSAYAAAAIIGGESIAQTERALEGLLDNYLIEEPVPGRYAFHDVVRTYATQLAEGAHTRQDQQEARRRLLGYYAHLASRADRIAYPFHRRVAFEGVVPAPVLPPMVTAQDCEKWMRAERQGLLSAARCAATENWPGHTAMLAHGLARFLDTWGDWADAVSLHQLAVGAWRSLANPSGEARALIHLCSALARTGRGEEALGCARQALTAARSARGQADEAEALSSMGVILRESGRHAEALRCQDDALDVWCSLGDRHGEAEALGRSAILLWMRSERGAALRRAEQALLIFRDLGDVHGETRALNNLGYIHEQSGHYDQARENYRRALDAFRETGDRQGEGIELKDLGDICRLSGQATSALDRYRTALGIFRDIGDRRMETETRLGMGSAYQAMNERSEALGQYQTALVIAHELAERHLQARAHVGMGGVRLAAGDVASAADDFRAAMELNRQVGDPGLEAEASDLLAKALHEPTES